MDARLVESASRPMSNDDLKKKRAQRDTEEGQKDKNGKPLKFSRDLESDWTIKNEVPHFGLKEHAAVDAKHGFILATIHSPASVHDTSFLQYCTIFSRHTNKSIKIVYADKGYAGLPNRNFLSVNKIADGIMRKDSTTAKLTEREIERNKTISKVRYIVEQYFGISHLHDQAKRARFTTILKNNLDAWFRLSSMCTRE
ncbi:transposase [Desulfosarcina cetonica]